MIGDQNSSSTSVKPERTTFIPPKSKYVRTQFSLYPNGIYRFKGNKKTTEEFRTDKPNKKETVWTEEFTPTNSPTVFRNYLTFSLSENSSQYFITDNEFYLKSVRESVMRESKDELSITEEERNDHAKKKLIKGISFYYLYEPGFDK